MFVVHEFNLIISSLLFFFSISFCVLFSAFGPAATASLMKRTIFFPLPFVFANGPTNRTIKKYKTRKNERSQLIAGEKEISEAVRARASTHIGL